MGFVRYSRCDVDYVEKFWRGTDIRSAPLVPGVVEILSMGPREVKSDFGGGTSLI